MSAYMIGNSTWYQVTTQYQFEGQDYPSFAITGAIAAVALAGSTLLLMGVG